MAEWEPTDAVGSCLKRWLHSPTGVELVVDRTGSNTYGVYIRATENGSIDTVSIGEPDTGLFRQFETQAVAIEWATEWKDTNSSITALVAVDSEDSTAHGE